MKQEISRNKIVNFLKKRPYIIWFVYDYKNISLESFVENTLNNGNFKDIKEMFNILDIKNTSLIFNKISIKKRSNIKPEIKNYFKLYFDKYAK